MKVYLYLVDKLLNYSLPHDISGSYSFDENPDEEAKLINIEARDNKWFLYSTTDVSVMINNKRVLRDAVPSVQLSQYKNLILPPKRSRKS